MEQLAYLDHAEIGFSGKPNPLLSAYVRYNVLKNKMFQNKSNQKAVNMPRIELGLLYTERNWCLLWIGGPQ